MGEGADHAHGIMDDEYMMNWTSRNSVPLHNMTNGNGVHNNGIASLPRSTVPWCKKCKRVLYTGDSCTCEKKDAPQKSLEGVM